MWYQTAFHLFHPATNLQPISIHSASISVSIQPLFGILSALANNRQLSICLVTPEMRKVINKLIQQQHHSMITQTLSELLMSYQWLQMEMRLNESK